jgi:hypothetical protein
LENRKADCSVTRMDEIWNVVEQLGSIIGAVVAFVALVQARRARELAERANWLTEAMESHSTLQLVIAARERGVKIIWWDRSRYGEFPSAIKHGEEVNLETIYLDFPPELVATAVRLIEAGRAQRRTTQDLTNSRIPYVSQRFRRRCMYRYSFSRRLARFRS